MSKANCYLEQVEYPKLFKIANKSGTGIVSGSEAIEFFAKSGLSPAVLSEVLLYFVGEQFSWRRKNLY